MRVATLCWSDPLGWTLDGPALDDPQAVIWFGRYGPADGPDPFEALRRLYPRALIAGCTTNGEIYRGEALDGAAVAAAIRFETSSVQGAAASVAAGEDAREAGRRLAAALDPDGLRGVFLLADAFAINSADLVEGLAAGLPADVVVTGGMAGDGGRLGGSTHAGLDRAPHDGGVAALGFYGAGLRIGHGVAGGWDPLGPSRHITRAEGPVVYELDGQPALEVYERLVGDSGSLERLRHPFCIKPEADSEQDIIWEVVDVDRPNKGIVFIGDVVQGSWGQIMRAVDDRLVEGAAEAARAACAGLGETDALGLMVSCIGRKWVMGQRIGDETEAVQGVSPRAPVIGFFSYGEVAPHARTGRSTLHHASVSVTTLSEAV
jgi:hypothetical protein